MNQLPNGNTIQRATGKSRTQLRSYFSAATHWSLPLQARCGALVRKSPPRGSTSLTAVTRQRIGPSAAPNKTQPTKICRAIAPAPRTVGNTATDVNGSRTSRSTSGQFEATRSGCLMRTASFLPGRRLEIEPPIRVRSEHCRPNIPVTFHASGVPMGCVRIT